MAKKKKTNPNVKVGSKWYSARTNLEHFKELCALRILHAPPREAGIFYRKYGREKYLIHPGPPGGQCIISKEQFQKLFTPSLKDGKIVPVNAPAAAGFERSFWSYIESNKKAREDGKKD